MRNSASPTVSTAAVAAVSTLFRKAAASSGEAAWSRRLQRIAAEHEQRDAEAREDRQADGGDRRSRRNRPWSAMRCGRVFMWVPRAA